MDRKSSCFFRFRNSSIVFWEKKRLLYNIGHVACSSTIKIMDGSILPQRRVIQCKERVPVWNLRSSLRDSVRAFLTPSLLGAGHLGHLGRLKRGFLLDFAFFNKFFDPFLVPLSFFANRFGLYRGRRN